MASKKQTDTSVQNRGLSDSAHKPTGRLRFHSGGRITPKILVRDAGARVLTTVYRRMAFLTYRLAGTRIPVYSASVPVEFGLLDGRHIEVYLRFRPRSSRAEIEKRLAAGHRCFVSWYSGEIIDACWTATESAYVPYLRRYLEVPDGDVYSYDSYTAPEFRAQGIYMARNSFTARQNQSEGLRRSIALVAVENYAAWLILTRSGLRTIGTYHFVRTPLRRFYWETTNAREGLPPLLAAPPERRMAPIELRTALGS